MSMSMENQKTLHNKLIEYGNARLFTKKREVYEFIIKFVDGLTEEASQDGYESGYEAGRIDGEEMAMDSGGF